MRGGVTGLAPLYPRLRDLIISGRAKLNFAVSTEIGIEDAADDFKRFSAHEETKAVVRFPWSEEKGLVPRKRVM